jgi:ribose transport system substrate-binding protein
MRGYSRRALLAAAGLIGCAEKRLPRITVVPKAVSHQFWLTVEKGVRRAGAQLKLDIEWNGPASESEFSRQIQIVEAAINKQVDGIALAPSEGKALTSVVERAYAAGIPVTIFDSAIDTQQFLSFVGSDNFAAGALAARAMGQAIGTGMVAMLSNAPGSFSTIAREDGFRQTLAKEFPGIKVVAEQFSHSDRARARANAENFLTAHPMLKGLFGSTDPSASGAALAVKAREKVGKVKVIAFDLSPAILEDLQVGAVQAMVIQDPEAMGFQAVATLQQKITGQVVRKKIEIPAQVVTKENLNDPEVKRLLS